MKKHRKVISYYIELFKAKRLDRWYRRTLQKRSYTTFIEQWEKQNGKADYNLLKKFANIMELPNYYIFPMDRMHILFCSPYSDLREVEAIILLEENGIKDLTVETINTKYKYAKYIFSKRQMQSSQ